MSYPEFGTSKIKCGKRGCGWTGKETDLVTRPEDAGKFAQTKVCPKCGCDSYTFVKPKREPVPAHITSALGKALWGSLS